MGIVASVKIGNAVDDSMIVSCDALRLLAMRAAVGGDEREFRGTFRKKRSLAPRSQRDWMLLERISFSTSMQA
ncbi:MAG: hypothetical protein QOF72_79 [Blastocatellia bacterium]|jgi:hypothetical protein|nr:hypothetical protein [Blastocatellia bacterium]